MLLFKGKKIKTSTEKNAEAEFNINNDLHGILNEAELNDILNGPFTADTLSED